MLSTRTLVSKSNDTGLWGRSGRWVFVHVGQAALADVQVFESMKHEYTQDDGDKAGRVPTMSTADILHHSLEEDDEEVITSG